MTLYTRLPALPMTPNSSGWCATAGKAEMAVMYFCQCAASSKADGNPSAVSAKVP